MIEMEWGWVEVAFSDPAGELRGLVSLSCGEVGGKFMGSDPMDEVKDEGLASGCEWIGRAATLLGTRCSRGLATLSCTEKHRGPRLTRANAQPPPNRRPTAAQESLYHEFHLLSRLSHPNVVHLFGGCLRPPRMFIVEELMAGTLTAAIHGRRGRLHLHTALRTALDVARGLEYLHSLGIVHRGARAWKP